jgi:hypothetical protein
LSLANAMISKHAIVLGLYLIRHILVICSRTLWATSCYLVARTGEWLDGLNNQPIIACGRYLLLGQVKLLCYYLGRYLLGRYIQLQLRVVQQYR